MDLPAGTPSQSRVQLPANSWPAESGPGKLIGWVLVALLALLSLIFLWRFVGSDGVVRGLWLGLLLASLVSLAFVAYQLWRLAQLRYTLTEDALVIERGREPIIVPYEQMLNVVYRSRDRINTGGYEPLWPGHYVSRFMTEEGVWESFASVPPNRRVRIRLRDRTIAISPMRPILFLEALAERRGSENTPVPEPTRVETVEPYPAEEPAPGLPADPPMLVDEPLSPPQEPRAREWPRRMDWRPEAYYLFREGLLGDRVTSELLALSIIILAAMSIYAGYSVDGLFQDVVIRWSPTGEPSEIVQPRGIWLFPALGLTILVVNTVLATLALLEGRFIARLIMGATPVLQLMAALALWWAVP